VVGYRNSFTWAFAGLSPWAVHYSKSNPAAFTIGFWVTFDEAGYLTQQQGTPGPIPGLGILPPSVKRLWFVGSTAIVVSPSTAHLTGSIAGLPIDLPWPDPLRSYGWSPGSTRLRAQGVYAQLYVRP
jgi:hypothetical protein